MHFGHNSYSFQSNSMFHFLLLHFSIRICSICEWKQLNEMRFVIFVLQTFWLHTAHTHSHRHFLTLTYICTARKGATNNQHVLLLLFVTFFSLSVSFRPFQMSLILLWTERCVASPNNKLNQKKYLRQKIFHRKFNHNSRVYSYYFSRLLQLNIPLRFISTLNRKTANAIVSLLFFLLMNKWTSSRLHNFIFC